MVLFVSMYMIYCLVLVMIFIFRPKNLTHCIWLVSNRQPLMEWHIRSALFRSWLTSNPIKLTLIIQGSSDQRPEQPTPDDQTSQLIDKLKKRYMFEVIHVTTHAEQRLLLTRYIEEADTRSNVRIKIQCFT